MGRSGSRASEAPTVMVIMDEGVGGSEKRLAEVWLALAPRIETLRMIIRGSTFAELLKRPDLAGLREFADRITIVDVACTKHPAVVRAFIPLLWRLPRGSIVHHILQYPQFLHRWRGHRTVFSWTSTTFPKLRKDRPAINNWIVSVMSLKSADLVDVLNPDVMKDMKARFRFNGIASLTAGGTFVDFDHFQPGAEKRDEVVFLGAMLRAKGVLEFVNAIPKIHERMAVQGRNVRFHLIGKNGDASDSIRDMLASATFAGIDVAVGPTADPAAVLGVAKVFVSLQHQSNYPSKALAEAMACGCVPIITDVGESRLMADEGSAVFLRRGFESEDLVEAVVGVLNLSSDAFDARSKATRVAATERFSLEVQVDYFERLYRSFPEQAN